MPTSLSLPLSVFLRVTLLCLSYLCLSVYSSRSHSHTIPVSMLVFSLYVCLSCCPCGLRGHGQCMCLRISLRECWRSKYVNARLLDIYIHTYIHIWSVSLASKQHYTFTCHGVCLYMHIRRAANVSWITCVAFTHYMCCILRLHVLHFHT